MTALALWLALGDKEDLVAAIAKLREARSYAFTWSGGWSSNEQKGAGEVEKSGLVHARWPSFEYAAAGGRLMYRVGGEWTDGKGASDLYRSVAYPLLLRLGDLLDLAEKAEKVAFSEGAFAVAVKGGDLRAAIEGFLPEGQRAGWDKYDTESFAWESSSGTLKISVDLSTGRVRRVALDFSMEMKSGRAARDFGAEFSIDGVDATRVKIPAELKKPLGLGEG